jgi:hypothetical protein
MSNPSLTPEQRLADELAEFRMELPEWYGVSVPDSDYVAECDPLEFEDPWDYIDDDGGGVLGW